MAVSPHLTKNRFLSPYHEKVSKMTGNSLHSMHPTHNHHCDGKHCTDPHSLVRIIKLDDSSNAHLCESCYYVETKEGGLPAYPFSIFPSLTPERQGAVA